MGWLRGLEGWGALLLRLTLGASMMYHGHDKVLPAHGLHGDWLAPMQRYSHFVGGLGLPPWLGYVSALTEFLGGVLLVLGLLTRLAALLVLIDMLVALCAVTLHHGYAASEYTLALAAIAFMLMATGSGAISVDSRLGLN